MCLCFWNVGVVSCVSAVLYIWHNCVVLVLAGHLRSPPPSRLPAVRAIPPQQENCSSPEQQVVAPHITHELAVNRRSIGLGSLAIAGATQLQAPPKALANKPLSSDWELVRVITYIAPLLWQ